MFNCYGSFWGQTGKDKNPDTIGRFQLTANTIDDAEKTSMSK